MKNEELLVQMYPRVFHMTHPDNWQGIRRFGLLSTTALLDLFEVKGKLRSQLEECPRKESVDISHPNHGRATVRDQKPLNAKKLESVLDDGLTVADWCRMLNRKVFFWGPESRLGILREAREYESRRQLIIVVDSQKLVQRYRNRIALCHMNSGNTNPMAFRRGRKTFLPIEEYPLSQRKKRGVRNAVAEVTIDHSTPDVLEMAVEVYEVGGGLPRRDLL